MEAPFALLLLVLFGRLKAKAGAWSPIPNRMPASLGVSPQPGSSQVRITEALLKNINQDEASWVAPTRLPHLFLDVILQGAEDRESGEGQRKQVPSSMPAAQPNPS